MTAIVIAGAASHEAVNWPATDWHKAHRNVRRLQARIVKVYPQWISCVQQRAFERLELLMGKPVRAVLRGLGGSNSVWLPGGGRESFPTPIKN